MKSLLLSLPIFVIILFSCKQTPESSNSTSATVILDDSAAARIDQLFEDIVSSNNVGGISALIYEKGKEVYYNAQGYQNKEKGIPMQRNTLIQIWSMTKPLVGTALMTLYEDGKFDLDDSLATYLPEYANMKVFTGVKEDGSLKLENTHRPITVRDITRHTAGFANNGNMEGLGPLYREADMMNRNNTLEDFSQKLAALPLMFQPGTQWAYGRCVSVQAVLVERLSGMPFYEYLRSEVLDPLGMDDTRYYVPPEDQDRLSAVYFRAGEGELEQRPDSQSLAYNTQKWPMTPGGYGLTSTLDDYMKFALMLQNEGTLGDVKILEPETVRLMATNHLADHVTERMWLPDRGQVGFGINFAVRLAPPVDSEENNGVVGEFFWDGAASTLFWVDPTNDLTAVMLVQLFPYDKIKLHNRFRDAVYGEFEGS